MASYTCQYCDIVHDERSLVKWLNLSEANLKIRIIICNDCVAKLELGIISDESTEERKRKETP